MFIPIIAWSPIQGPSFHIPYIHCHCSCFCHKKLQESLYLSTTRHPQDVKYKRSTSGALPLVSTFKCDSSPRRCLCRALSRRRVLPARRPPLVSPEAANIKISLLVLDQVCLVSASNRCFQIQARQQGAGGRAGRRQEHSSCTHEHN